MISLFNGKIREGETKWVKLRKIDNKTLPKVQKSKSVTIIKGTTQQIKHHRSEKCDHIKRIEGQ